MSAIKPTRSKIYTQKYTKAWETNINLEDWIAPDPTCNTQARCKICRVSLAAHKKDLLVHGKSLKHESAVKSDKLALHCKSLPVVKRFPDKTKIAELKLAAFIAEHASINTIDHLSELLKQIDPDSNVFKNLKLHRTKCCMLIKNVLSPCMLKNLITDVRDLPYSLVIDESSDISNQIILCIMIKYFSMTKNTIVTTFCRIVRIYDASANGIHSALKTQLVSDGLKLNKIVGIGVDGASVMVGCNHSVKTLLQEEIPDIIIVQCVCHSLHLCVEKAAEVLPRQLDFLVRQAHSWFSYSSKRTEEYQDLYSAMNNGDNNPKKIPGLSGTRWLARAGAIDIILRQWDELLLLFSLAKNADKCLMAENLCTIMRCLHYKAFLVFLNSMLKNIIRVNLLFQSEKADPVQLFDDLFLLFKNTLQRIVVPAQLQKVRDSDLATFNFEAHLMHTSAISFGYDFETVAKDISATDLADVRERCKKFLCKLCTEMQQRLPGKISALKSMSLLVPSIATSQQKPRITNLINEFSRVEVFGEKNVIEDGWNALANKTWKSTKNTIEFWAEVMDDVDSCGNKRFGNIAQFSLSMLSTPLLNATVERAFSIYSTIKDKLG